MLLLANSCVEELRGNGLWDKKRSAAAPVFLSVLTKVSPTFISIRALPYSGYPDTSQGMVPIYDAESVLHDLCFGYIVISTGSFHKPSDNFCIPCNRSLLRVFLFQDV